MRIGIDGDVSRRVALEHWAAQMEGMQASIARLSSGLRINSAVDDAAGLAIAEKMRSQVLGARQAQANAQDGISLVRVADGALEQSMGLLQKMRVIAVQAANGTWSDGQRAALQLIMDGALEGIDEIARTTQYNTLHLLDGSRSGLSLQVGAQSGQTLAVTLAGAARADLGLGTPATTTTTYQTVTTTTPDQTVTTTNTTYTYAATSPKGGTGTVTGAPTAGTFTAFANGTLQNAGGQVVGSYDTASFTAVFAAGGSVDFAQSVFNGGSGKGTITVTSTPHTTTTTTTIPGSTTTTQVASTVTTPGTSLSVMSQEGAGAALNRIDAAIALLQDRRTELGAVEVALTHAISAMGSQELNMAATEGRIRDVDAASEVSRLLKMQTAAEAGAEAVSKALLSQFAAVNALLGVLDHPADNAPAERAGQQSGDSSRRGSSAGAAAPRQAQRGRPGADE